MNWTIQIFNRNDTIEPSTPFVKLPAHWYVEHWDGAIQDALKLYAESRKRIRFESEEGYVVLEWPSEEHPGVTLKWSVKTPSGDSASGTFARNKLRDAFTYAESLPDSGIS